MSLKVRSSLQRYLRNAGLSPTPRRPPALPPDRQVRGSLFLELLRSALPSTPGVASICSPCASLHSPLTLLLYDFLVVARCILNQSCSLKAFSFAVSVNSAMIFGLSSSMQRIPLIQRARLTLRGGNGLRMMADGPRGNNVLCEMILSCASLDAYIS